MCGPILSSQENLTQLLTMERTYQVTYARDYLDPNPTVKTFNEWYEMQDWITEEVERRVQQAVKTINNYVDPEDRTSQEEIEYTLINIKEV